MYIFLLKTIWIYPIYLGLKEKKEGFSEKNRTYYIIVYSRRLLPYHQQWARRYLDVTVFIKYFINRSLSWVRGSVWAERMLGIKRKNPSSQETV